MPSMTEMQAILQQREAAAKQRQDLLTQPLNTGLLNEGQTIGDFFKDPTQAQNNAMLQASLSLLGSDGRKSLASNFGAALNNGLGALGSAREKARTQELQAANANIADIDAKFGANLKLAELAPKAKEGQFVTEVGPDGKLRRVLRSKTTAEVMGYGGEAPKSSGTTVNVGGNKAIDEVATQTLLDFNVRAVAAQDVISTVRQARSIVNSADFGPGTEITDGMKRSVATMARWAGYEGAELDSMMQDVTDVQQMRSIQMDLVAKRFAATKGAISDKEHAAFMKSVANMDNTRDANNALLNYSEAMAMAEIQREEAALDWVATHTNTRGFNVAWENYIRDNSFMDAGGGVKQNHADFSAYANGTPQEWEITKPTEEGGTSTSVLTRAMAEDWLIRNPDKARDVGDVLRILGVQ